MSYADSTKEDSAANPLWNHPPPKGEGRCRSIPPLETPLFFVLWNIGWALDWILMFYVYCIAKIVTLLTLPLIVELRGI